MTKDKAKQIGSMKALKSVIIGLIIAQLIMTFMMASDEGIIKAFFWFATVNYKFNLLIGSAILLLSGHFFGQLAGKAILIKKYNFILVGFLCGMTVLLTTAFFSGWAGFFQEGLKNIGTDDNPFEDYIFKPLYWISIYGIVPALLVGIWFGWQIKKQDKAI